MNKDEFDMLWKQYEDNVSLYKFYFDLAMRIIILYCGIIGGIFAFYIVHQTFSYIKFILIIPIFLSIFFSIYSLLSIKMIQVIEDDLRDLTSKMNMQSWPTTVPLIYIMYICSIVFFFIFIGLIFIFFI